MKSNYDKIMRQLVALFVNNEITEDFYIALIDYVAQCMNEKLSNTLNIKLWQWDNTTEVQVGRHWITLSKVNGNMIAYCPVNKVIEIMSYNRSNRVWENLNGPLRT